MPIRKSNDTLFYLIGIIPVVWLALLLAQSLGGGLPELLRNLTSALEQPTNIIWTDKSLPTILICLAAYGMAVLLYRTNQGRTRDGEEHGSAAWATPASVNAQFAQKESIPLTQHVRRGLDTHKHRRSLNVLVIGGSGAAKTRSFVLPNILTANTNYVITDPKSEVLLATGGYLKEQGYELRYPMRALAGTNEETHMQDVDYYLKNYPAPAFCFTPDAEFPVCNGEKGLFGAKIVSPVCNGVIV